MSGLDKIIGHISAEAENEAKEILRKAQAEADALKKDAETKTAEECGRIAKKSEAEVRGILERGGSSAELKKKQILLRTKQELIDQTIRQAGVYLNGLDEAAYFDVIRKLFVKNMLGRAGEISFNQRDLDRLPAGFLDELQTLAGQKGGSVSLSKAAADIDGGFVLNYGGIEENCSFQALIDGSLELLQDRVQKVLFA